jgi:Pyruvate kinase, barrel domain
VRDDYEKRATGGNDDARAIKTTFDLGDPTRVASTKALTKIVATIGPTSEQLEPLEKVVRAGMKVMRLNFSHATTEEVELRLKNLALCQVRVRSDGGCSLDELWGRSDGTNQVVSVL